MHFLEVAERGMLRVGVKHCDVVAEEEVWTERNFLKIRDLQRIDKVNVLLTESLELGVAMMLSSKTLVGERLRRRGVHEPHIGIARLAENGFKTQRKTAAMVVVSPSIGSSCIGNDATHGAVSSRHIPGAASEPFCEYFKRC